LTSPNPAEAGSGDLVVIAEVFAREDSVAELEEMLREHTERCHEEPGILVFAVHRDREDPRHFAVIEVYESYEDIERHRGTERYQALMEQIPELIEDRSRLELEPLPAGDPAKGRLA
jgi:quinol monooxygenase YgiN